MQVYDTDAPVSLGLPGRWVECGGSVAAVWVSDQTAEQELKKLQRRHLVLRHVARQKIGDKEAENDELRRRLAHALRENGELLHENNRLMTPMRRRFAERLLSDTEYWPPDDWTTFDDFELFEKN